MGLRLLLVVLLVFPVLVPSGEERGVVHSPDYLAVAPTFAPLALRYRQELQQRLELSVEMPMAYMPADPTFRPLTLQICSTALPTTVRENVERWLQLCSLLL